MVFKLDNNPEPSAGGAEIGHKPLLRFALGNIAKEMLEPFGACDYLITGENEAVALCQYAQNERPAELEAALREVQGFMKRYFKLSVSMGVGDVYCGRKNISLSYTSALQYVRYRLIYGKASILDAQKTRSHIMTSIGYPTEAEQLLIEAVQSGKEESVREAAERFMARIAPGSVNQVVTYSIQCMLSLLKHFDYLRQLPDADFAAYLDAVAEIESAEYMEDILDLFVRYGTRICGLIEEKNHWLNAQKHNIVIEKAQAYIQAHYDEPNLSLELVANIAGLSPSYLGKLFKGATGQSFSEYLSGIRLEKARSLLASTQTTAAKISESVGIYNTTYFSTLFKKKYGLSPSAFREREAMKQRET